SPHERDEDDHREHGYVHDDGHDFRAGRTLAQRTLGGSGNQVEHRSLPELWRWRDVTASRNQATPSAADMRSATVTNSCSGQCTVNTGQGAVRTTRSATLPRNMRDTPWRPCVPMTMRSMSCSCA